MTTEFENNGTSMGEAPPEDIGLPAVIQINQNPATNWDKAYSYLKHFWEKQTWFQKKLESEEDPYVLVEADSTGTRASIMTKEQAALAIAALTALGITTGYLIKRYIDFKNEQKKD